MLRSEICIAETVENCQPNRRETVRVSLKGPAPVMEAKMFTTLMNFGSYRVDYLNKQRIGDPHAVGLYILGNLSGEETYSRSAKRALYLGLTMVREQLGMENLVGIYVDINCPNQTSRQAYLELKKDVKAGMFRRVLVQSLSDLFSDADSFSDWWNFYRELARCEILTMADGLIKPTPVLYWPGGTVTQYERTMLCKKQ